MTVIFQKIKSHFVGQFKMRNIGLSHCHITYRVMKQNLTDLEHEIVTGVNNLVPAKQNGHNKKNSSPTSLGPKFTILGQY